MTFMRGFEKIWESKKVNNQSRNEKLSKNRKTDLEADNTLAEENVTDGDVNVLGDWVTGVDHETVSEFHGLGTLTT